MKGIVGTTEGAADSNDLHPTVSVNANTYLIDASFDHSVPSTGGSAYRLSRDGDGFKSFGTAAQATADATKWKYKEISSDTYYVAYLWTIDFIYEFGAETAPVDLFFDVQHSSTSLTATDSGTNSKTMDTKKGFRIAFIGGDHNIVWGDMADNSSKTTHDNATPTNPEDDTQEWTYVNGTSSSNIGKYSAPTSDVSEASKDFIHSGTGETALAEDEASADYNGNRTNRIATITMGKKDTADNTTFATDKKGSWKITCVAWFEGTDPNVVNDSKLQTLSASMQFYARSTKAA